MRNEMPRTLDGNGSASNLHRASAMAALSSLTLVMTPSIAALRRVVSWQCKGLPLVVGQRVTE